MERIYIMLDTETTGLDTRNAVAWQIGMAVFTPDYIVDSEFESTCGVPMVEWESSTLDFAHKTYGMGQALAACSTGTNPNYLEFMTQATSFIEGVTKQYGFKNVWLICNHVEFDWPIFLNSLARAGMATPLTGYIHYRNKLDMQSLCMGKVGRRYEEVYNRIRHDSQPVQHKALADCISQINLLYDFGVALPR